MVINFEKALALHCAPTLLGAKPANLMSLSKEKYPDLLQQLKTYYSLFSCRGLRLKLLWEYDQRFLLLVYREKQLENHLFSADLSNFLAESDYPVEKDLYALLQHLKCRIAEGGDFPHEIGAFLGYPIEDIRGFIEHRGKNYITNGYWKVYNNKEQREKLFETYNQCKNILSSCISEGKSIISLIHSVA